MKINLNRKERCAFFKLDILVHHPNLDPTVITEAFSLEPIVSWQAGKPWFAPNGNRKPGLAPDTRWRYVVYCEDGNDLGQSIGSLINALESARDTVEMILSGQGKIFVNLSLSGKHHQGHEIPAAVISRLAHLGVSLGIEVYPDWDLPSRNTYTPLWPDVLASWADCLDMFANYGKIFSFVSRPGYERSEVASNFLNVLKQQNKFLSRAPINIWPGTTLLGRESATVYSCTYDAEVITILKENAPPISEWLHPGFFENFFLYRTEGKDLFFGSIIHERDCFFELTEAEAEELKELVPSLSRDA